MAAYVIAQLTVTDMPTFERYRADVPATIRVFGGRYIVRGGAHTVLEGDDQVPRLVILEFNDRDTALRWYHSDAYQKILPLRLASASGRVVIVDGIEDMTP